MLRARHGELQPDALVARQQRQIPVRRGARHHFDVARGLEPREGRDQIAPLLMEPGQQSPEPRLPEVHQRQERAVARLRKLAPSLVAGGQPLRDVGLELRSEERIGELVGQDRRDGDGERRPHAARGQLGHLLDQREVGVERRLAQPVAAVRPAAVAQDVREVAVQREDEIHGRRYPATSEVDSERPGTIVRAARRVLTGPTRPPPAPRTARAGTPTRRHRRSAPS